MEPIDYTTWAWTYTNTTGNPIDINGTMLAPGESRTFRGSADSSAIGAEQFLDSYNQVMAQLPPGSSYNDPSMDEALRQALEQAQAYEQGHKKILSIPDLPPAFNPTAQDGPLTHVEEPQNLTGRVSTPSKNATAHMSRVRGRLQSEPPPKEPLPGHKEKRSNDEEAQKITSADPVDLFTGEFFLEKIDFFLPSVGFPFSFLRTYKSGRSYFGPFGYNWDHNYNIYLRKLAGGRIAVNTGCLHEDLYTDSGDSVLYHAPRAVFAKLQRQAAGSQYSYVLTFRGGITWAFAQPSNWSHSERIPLVKIADQHGNTQQLIYDSSNRLAQVIDTVGRAIDFFYGDCDRLEALRPAFLQTPGALPVEVKYLHTGDTERLSTVITFPTPDFPEGLTTEYEYDDAQSSGELRNNITRVIDSKGQTIVENTYGTDLSDPAFNRVVKQYFDGAEYLFKYTPLKFVPPYDEHINDECLQVEVYEAEQPLKLYTFNFRGNLLDERFRLCADGSYRVWAQAYRYTKTGQLAERYHPDGMAEVFKYDETNLDLLSQGLLLQVDLKSQPNRLLSRTMQRFTYEPQYYRIKTITDEAGKIVTFIYDYELDPLATAGNLMGIEYPDVMLPDGTLQTVCRTTFQYDAYGQLVEHVSPAGRKTTYEYYLTGAGAGMPKSQTQHNGAQPIVESFEYDALGYLVRHVDARGSDTLLKHNLIGQIYELQLRAIDGRRASFRYEYNEDRKVAREYVPRGAYSDDIIQGKWIVHEYEYDIASRLKRQKKNINTAALQVTNFSYDVHGRVRKVTDPMGRETMFKYDERGLVLEQKLFSSDVSPLETTFQYDRTGHLTKIRHNDGTEEQFNYAENFGRLRWKANRLGVRKEFSYGMRDELHIMELKDASGNILQTWQYAYDEKGRLVHCDLNGLAKTFYYDCDNMLVRAVDHRRRAIHYTYDGLGRITDITDPLGTVARTVLDCNGNRVGGQIEYHSTRTGTVASFEERTDFDARDRLITSTDRFGNQVKLVFDDRDLRIEVIDAQGNHVLTEYDINGLPILTALKDGDAEKMIRRWHRDLMGRILAFEDADGNLTRYDYDSKDNLILVTYPDASTFTKTYNALNVLVSEKDANESIVSYNYNTMGQLTDIGVQPGSRVAPTAPMHFSYDPFGRLQRIDDGTHFIERTYDFLNRTTEEKQGPFVIRHIYDDLADRVRLVYSDGREDELEMDGVGRITQILFRKKGTSGLVAPEIPEGTPLAQYSYDGILLTTCRMANNVVTEYKYDQDAKLIGREVKNSAGILLDREQRFYDSEKRARLNIREPHVNHHTVYHYDALSRLTGTFTLPGSTPVPASIAGGGGNQAAVDAFVAGIDTANAPRQEQFVLALNDRRVSWNQDDVVLVPAYNNLLQITYLQDSNGVSMAFKYDSNGNRIEDNHFRYGYDVFDRLVSITDKLTGQPALEFTYDPVGRVVERKEDGVTTRFVFDGTRALEELRGGTRVQRTFGTGIDEIIAESGTTNIFCHQDEIGSLRAVTDGNGTVMQFFSYSAFGLPSRFNAVGQPLADSAPGPAPIFGGRPYYRSIGLYDMRARLYDPWTGTFLQRDAAHYTDSSNPYLYCRHNPIGVADPNGCVLPIIVGVAAAAVLGAGSGAVFGSIRQLLQIATGSTDEYGNLKKEFSWERLGEDARIGAAMGFGVYLSPALAGIMVIVGTAGGVTEMVNGNSLVGAFDIATSIYGIKGIQKFRNTSVASRFNKLGLETLISLEGIRLKSNLAFMTIFGFHPRRLTGAFSALTRTAELRVAQDEINIHDPMLRIREEFAWESGPRAGKTAGEVDARAPTAKKVNEVKTGDDFMEGLMPTRREREFLHEPSDEIYPGQLDRYRMFFPDHEINLWVPHRYFIDPRTGKKLYHREFKGQIGTLQRLYPEVKLHDVSKYLKPPNIVADFSSPLSPLASIASSLDLVFDQLVNKKSPSQKS